jgi:carbon monoxide dehydrogenase subunit G
MDVQLDKRYPLAVTPNQAWAVLQDVRAVAGCMPGAQITQQLDETHYQGTVRCKVGPAVMSFNGDIEVLGIDAGARRIELLGKGADRGGSSAAMQLAAHIEPGETPDSAVLVGTANVTVSGKLAQFGSRLLVPVADAMLAQFAEHFRAAAAAIPASDTPLACEAGQGSAEGGALPQAVAASADASAHAPAPATPPEPPTLNALSLLWQVIRGWWAGLFGR